ncbi:uncharacterized protein LOC124953079 [Vespa velutina]|uniref:uncharacterized protein LOC124953079 n=1 Tax=Vespa velutina TaxID=202808 RepID=UPI001FB564AF|nr:uncharacterized protein LOC124953079 [Vespa velutina]XP_047359926.1 uncharacterized protein LOC124953079 [Vespa velutina]XP_047359927.1 uncharacterized protein LOC124953079 [Vespa velutina]
MRILIVSLLICIVASEPGLLRVPKVYNAVITSNQNLSPSRAYPVIQPVIHRTAIGYVPPFYYTHVAPHLAGPEVVHLPRTESPNIENIAKPEDDDASKESITKKEDGLDGSNVKKIVEDSSKKNENGKNGEDDVPLSFYPNYQSLYYDPYFYTYNTFNPHLIPGTYYVDYQPFAPIPPVIPKPSSTGRLQSSHSRDENNDGIRRKEEGNKREKIPDVPPPPVPTSSPNNSR